MSENIMENSNDQLVVTGNIKASRRRFKFESDLPSPPPDPQSGAQEHSPGVMTSAVAALNAEDAFVHLTRLHTLVEEILNLREKNSTLFRRVRQLEKIKTLKNANNDVELCRDAVLHDEDMGFAEFLLGAMLSNGIDTPRRSSSISKSTGVCGTGQFSAGERRVSCPVAANATRTVANRARTSTLSSSIVDVKRPVLTLGQPKISKWTRVKAAFKWEKAACNPNENPCDPEVIIKYLRPQEHLAVTSEVSGLTTPIDTISSSSSIDDVFHRPQSLRRRRNDGAILDTIEQDPSQRSGSLDGDVSFASMNFGSIQPRTKENFNVLPKTESRLHRTTWGKMKDIIQVRKDILARQTSRRSQNEDNHSTSSLDSNDIHRPEHEAKVSQVRLSSESSLNSRKPSLSPPECVDLATRRLTPTLTITVPSSEELRNISTPEPVTPTHSRPISESERSGKSPTDDGFREKSEQISPAGSSSSGIFRYGQSCRKISSGIPRDLKRQQSLKGRESFSSSPKMQRRDSKWNKVKRAFLTSAASVPTSPSRISSYFFDDGETAESYCASPEDLDDTSNQPVQTEIQRNYRLLYDKLDTEFYRKLAEWEKLKSSNSTSIPKECTSKTSLVRDKDTENLRLMGCDRLTPEFKKKLEEWKRMGKLQSANESTTISKRRITDWQLWRSPSKAYKLDSPGRLSDDFIKKMEEWKRIKAAAKRDDENDGIARIKMDNEEEVGVSTENIKQNSHQSSERFKNWKALENEEFKSLETVLSEMEAERQTRLSKLHRVVGSAPAATEEVLIRTSMGFFRFEGINRKFTRRLYEWEKSQGIAPELSTFRLLDPYRYGITSHTRATTTSVAVVAENRSQRSLSRCKSVGSVNMDAWSNRGPRSLARLTSSLSLNDMECLDARSIIVSSVPTINDEEDTSDDNVLDDAEPQAMIVDIEDVIEETASPMTKLQPHQTPVYSVASSETTSIAIPLGTVTARHEPSPVILIEPGEPHPIEISTTDEGELVSSNEEQSHPRKLVEVSTNIPSTINNFEEDDNTLPEVVITVGKNSRSKRHGLKTRRLTDTQVGYDWQRMSSEISKDDGRDSLSPSLSSFVPSIVQKSNNDDYLNVSTHERILINENTLNKIVVPTSSGTLATTDCVPVTSMLKKTDSAHSDGHSTAKKDKRDPQSVFVKTKRIVFSPFRREVKEKGPEVPSSQAIDESAISSPTADTIKQEQRRLSVPKSPIPARKEYKSSPSKETAPSIRLMIKKYNEKLESSSTNAGSTTSSGSGSPIWRSPVHERRIRDRMEKYQEEVRKAIAGPRANTNTASSGITKSATVDFAPKSKLSNSIDHVNTVIRSGTSPEIPYGKSAPIEADDSSSTASIRSVMLQKAKIDFLSQVSNDLRAHKVTNVDGDQDITYENDETNVVTNSSSELVRSVSAAMINVDLDTYERLQLTTNQSCDTPPRCSEQSKLHADASSSKECTSRFHQLTNKFKKVRLRKSKDKDFGSMSTVSMLCRQSLVVDIAETSKSCPTTPSPQHENDNRNSNTSRKIV